MSQIPSNFAALGQQPTPAAAQPSGNDLRDVDLDHFLKLLITELQNQDPLNPLDNSEILQQISQIREIGATNLLTETLQTVLTGQNLATASSLIGRRVNALTDDAENIEGEVDRVSMETGADDQRILRVHIGDGSVKLENIREIFEATGEPTTVDPAAA